MNKESSRSHSVFILKIMTTESKNGTKSVRTSRFNLIDLAGSERQKSAKTAGKELKEASAINKSLSTLGAVITALASRNKGGKAPHVPYRDSALTWLLKACLGGNARASMLAAISPDGHDFMESLSTLRYADSAKQIVNNARVNLDPNAALIGELKSEIEELRARLAGASS